MNILLVIKNFDFGGAENHVCDLANGLVIKGHQVYLLSGSGRQVAKLHPDIKFIKTNLRNSKIPLHILWLIYFLILKRIDVIHAHQHFSILISGIAGFFTGTRVVATVHGRNRYDLSSWVARCLTDKIIYVSKAVQYFGEKRKIIKKKSVYIPNGIVLDGCNGSIIPGSVNYMSTINHHHYFFLRMLIQEVAPVVVKRFPHFHLHITGEGSMLSALNHEAAAVNKSIGKEFVIIVGYKSGLLSEGYSASLVMGVGRVALEACARGIPLFSVNKKRMGGLLTAEKYEILKNYNFIDTHSEPPTATEVTKVLISFLENEPYWNDQARIISERVIADFSMDSILDKIIQTYQN